MQRMGMVIHVKPEKIDEYKALHAVPWPAIVERLQRSNITNYSIFLKEPENLLFGYWEYVGTDFEADMAAIAADAETQRWWKLTDPCQIPFVSRNNGEHWATMENVFHID
ncbi:L-rhamnose mutarotase [Paraburkholderia sp. MM5496-R1]|uniref:L-rhamnose mutarotase n=1 Tax=unclassified Paraburkholderia TaxID=2615204 RepID=UPI003D25FEB3